MESNYSGAFAASVSGLTWNFGVPSETFEGAATDRP